MELVLTKLWWMRKYMPLRQQNFIKLEFGELSHKWWLQDIVDRVARNPLKENKANLKDLIAAIGLVILLKLDSNRRFFSPCYLEIRWMTPKNNRAPLLCYLKLFASFRSHWWIQTGVTVRKRLIWVKIDDLLAVWTWSLMDGLEKQ